MQVKNTIHGTLYKCKGKYRIIISYYDEEGKRKQKTYATGLSINGNKRRAEQMLNDRLAEFKEQLKGYQSADGNCTLTEWVSRYIRHKQNEVRPSTIHHYTHLYKKHILPYFGNNVALRDVSPKIINEFTYHLDSLISYSSAKNVLSLLSGSLDYAIEQEIIANNPCKCVKHYNNKTVYHPQQKRVWNSKEVDKVLAALKDTNIYEAIAVAIFYGLRRGELLGLTWDNVGFDNKRIYIYVELLMPERKLMNTAKLKVAPVHYQCRIVYTVYLLN